ncbi:MAG: DUF1674 domain-containing protein [Kiloniellales bacterium]|nr:DUF1674 domain-containing protein [Kiloniellales bacterium]
MKGAGSPPPRPRKAAESAGSKAPDKARPKEIGGPEGPEPTRYGDWERKGICVDF